MQTPPRRKDISIHAPHEGERQLNAITANKVAVISIHAPHEGERRQQTKMGCLMLYFNPRSPRGGATILRYDDDLANHKFQSTLPTRGSDIDAGKKLYKAYNISIHAPHEGERLSLQASQSIGAYISIHAPHEGERRFIFNFLQLFWQISIHAPHEGERQHRIIKSYRRLRFQSTLPTRGSDQAMLNCELARLRFQSTLPTRGSDIWLIMVVRLKNDFNPRSPRGGATTKTSVYAYRLIFQSTLPTRGSDRHLHRP